MTKLFFNIYFYFVYRGFAGMCLHHLCTFSGQKRASEPHGTGAMYVCDGCWELLPEQQVLLTGSSLQPENLFLTVYFQVVARKKKNPNQKTNKTRKMKSQKCLFKRSQSFNYITILYFISLGQLTFYFLYWIYSLSIVKKNLLFSYRKKYSISPSVILHALSSGKEVLT